ncbi:hypothetical protein [Roseicyclus sp.]|uniref:hypothetical protein n=1 Tax=Roseicyclus sp. TaxID=1914329 RepID=UPI003FA033D3
MKRVHVFVTAEDGAVTVDWVMISAAVVSLGLATTAVVTGGVANLSGEVETTLEDYEISTSFAAAAAPWQAGQWEMNNPGAYESNVTWMAGFTDENLLAHMNNMEQYSELPPGSGHPLDTYHDEYWIARDEAISRGLVDPTT